MRKLQAPVLFAFFSTLLALFFSSFGNADPQSKSYSHWSVANERVSVVLTISKTDAQRLVAAVTGDQTQALWRNRTVDNLSVITSSACILMGSAELPASAGYLRRRLEWKCPEPLQTRDSLLIEVNELFSAVPSHMHFANFHLQNGVQKEKLFGSSDRKTTLELGVIGAVGESESGVFSSYLRFGFEHILIGFDHLAFLLGLFLLRGSWRQMLWVVTGFTLGHSITLSLNVLGYLEPNVRFTEALIGLSIALVAIENVAVRSMGYRAVASVSGGVMFVLFLLAWIYPGVASPLSLAGLVLFCWCYLQLSDSPATALRCRPVLTTVFGLVHGFGFAGVLLEVGLPKMSQTAALVGFNVGVELGQAIIVLGFIGITILVKRMGIQSGLASNGTMSAGLCGLGVYWFVQRLYF